MTKRIDNRKMRLCVLSRIKENKKTLFGAFSEKLGKQDKMRVWKEIGNYAKSIGVVDDTKDWNYIRDVWWPNVKKLTMKKIDNSKQTGGEGGKDKILSEVDEAVLDILGKDSPTVVGLPVSESLEEEIGITPIQVDENAPEPAFKPSLSTSMITPLKTSKRSAQEPIFHESNNKDEDTKRQLQVKLLELQIYKTKMECRKLEIEMGIPQSCYTSDIKETMYTLPRETIIIDGDVNENVGPTIS